MANWYGTALSNAFTVKDYNAFLDDVIYLDLEILRDFADPNKVKLFSETADGGFPTEYYDIEANEYIGVSLPEIIQEHITEDSYAVLQEVGNEKMRYVTGWACAITSNDVKYINLDDINDIAKQMMGD